MSSEPRKLPPGGRGRPSSESGKGPPAAGERKPRESGKASAAEQGKKKASTGDKVKPDKPVPFVPPPQEKPLLLRTIKLSSIVTLAPLPDLDFEPQLVAAPLQPPKPHDFFAPRQTVKKEDETDFDSYDWVNRDEEGSGSEGSFCGDELEHNFDEGDPEFIHPRDVHIGNVGTFLIEGQVKHFVSSHFYSPSEFYLIKEREFPKVQQFVEKMTDAYFSWAKKGVSRMFARKEDLQIKSVVAILAKTEEGKSEWLRAQILEYVPETEMFKCLAIDLGKHLSVGWGPCVAYLHKNFAVQKSWAAKCRLFLSSHYDTYHEGAIHWGTEVTNAFHKILNRHALKTKFLRSVEIKGEAIWEVSIIRFKWMQPGITHDRPVEHQIIEKQFGSYLAEN